MKNPYAWFVSETAIDRNIPRSATWNGSTVCGDITTIPGLPESLGLLPFDEVPPPEQPAQEGSHYEPRYSVIDGRIAETWVAVPDPPPPQRSLSKRKLYRALDAAGIWEGAKLYMEDSGVWQDWEYATTLDEDDPLIVAAISALKQQLGLSDEQIEAILAASVAEG